MYTSLTDSVQLRMLFTDHAWLSASPIISQQYCELQSSHKCHLSRQWWQKGHFSWYVFFLNIWIRLLFAGDNFAGVRSIESATLSLEHKTFLQVALWFRRSNRLAASWMRCSLRETLEKLFFASCLLHTCRALPRANLQISIFRAHATHPKVASVSSGTKASAPLEENRKGCVCCYCFMNDRIRNFWEAICISRMRRWFLWFSGINTVEPKR